MGKRGVYVSESASAKKLRKYRASHREEWNAYMRAYTEKNKDRVSALRRAWRERNREKVTARERERNKGRDHRIVLLAKYGMTRADYESLLSICPGCAICGKLPGKTNGGRPLAVDHDHKTGRVRGLLCENCNNGLGRFKDNPAFLREAVGYLEAFPKKEAST